MAEILKGGPVAKALTERLAAEAQALRENGISPTLAILRIGERPDDIAYENAAINRCEKAGVDVKLFTLPKDAGPDDVLDAVEEINTDYGINGCLMMRPLEKKFVENTACLLLRPEKDVDCMTPGSLAGVFSGSGEGFAPCTAQAVIELLKFYGIPLKGKRVCVLGRSLVIGKPLAMLMLAEDATVTVCHSKTENLADICREADVLVLAVGRAEFADASFVREGQVVVDVGINVREDGSLCGDVDFASVEPIVAAITPVPLGVGSVTTAVLAKHVVEAAKRQF